MCAYHYRLMGNVSVPPRGASSIVNSLLSCERYRAVKNVKTWIVYWCRSGGKKIAPRCVLHRGIVKVPCGCCVIYNIPLIAGTSIKKLRLWRWAAAAVAASERPFGLIKRRCEITGRSRAGIILAGPGYDVVLLPQAEQWRYHRYIGVGIGPVWRTCTLHRWGVFTIDGSDTADLPLNEPSSAETMPDSNPKRDYLFGWQVPDADIVVSFYRQKDVRQIIHLVTLFIQFRSVCLHGIYFLVGDDLIRRS